LNLVFSRLIGVDSYLPDQGVEMAMAFEPVLLDHFLYRMSGVGEDVEGIFLQME
jgi:hypothetical protein